MINSRITAKERNLIKGAIRRVFSRSELRRKMVDLSIIKHEDKTRPRVKTWCMCPHCGKPQAKSNMQVDHKIPLVKINETLDDLDWNTIVNRLWCEEGNLQALCLKCHKSKSMLENKERRLYKKGKLNG